MAPIVPISGSRGILITLDRQSCPLSSKQPRTSKKQWQAAASACSRISLLSFYGIRSGTSPTAGRQPQPPPPAASARAAQPRLRLFRAAGPTEYLGTVSICPNQILHLAETWPLSISGFLRKVCNLY
jgi:hypothetical protein